MVGVKPRKKRSVLIQNREDLSYVGLCSEGMFRFKMMIDGKFHEVALIEPKDEGFLLTIFPPLVNSKNIRMCQWVEEALYHFNGYTRKLNQADQKKIMNYFGEK